MPEGKSARQPDNGYQMPARTAHPFDYQAPTEKQRQCLNELTEKFKAAYEAILDIIPNCRERSLAITKLQEARMWANAGVVFTPDEWLALEEDAPLPKV